MTDSERDAAHTPLNPLDPAGEDKRRKLAGEREAIDQAAFVAPGEVGSGQEGLTGTERYQGYLETGEPAIGSDERVDALLDRELRSGETSDPFIAADEGQAYVPPTDPVVVPDEADPQGIRVASGTGASSMEEPYDADHHGTALPSEDEVSARVREALLADAATSAYADRVGIESEGGIVTIRGEVDDLEDADAITAIASIVSGVSEVRDETEVRGL